MARTPGGTLSAFTLLSTPDAPTITSISTSIGSASVAFTAPTDTGDGAISSYVVTAVDESNGASTGATGTSSPISISLGGGTFKIRMQALNPYGPGRLTEYDTGNVIYSGAELYLWGSGGAGRLGDGAAVNRSSPVQIGALTTWAKVSINASAAGAIKTDNTLWMWGNNGFGALGDNTSVSRSSPVQVGALTVWSELAVEGNTTAAIRTNGTLWTWGANYAGQLGQNFSGFQRSSPIQVGLLTDWAKVTAFKEGAAFTSIKSNGTLWAWGRNNSSKLGDTTVTYRSSPVQIGALTNWSRTASGSEHTIAIKTDGTLWSWGSNSYGQLANNSVTGTASPIQIGALTTWSDSGAGIQHSVAVKTDGTLWSWGRGSSGQLGHNNTTNLSSPVQVGSLATWSLVEGGNFHTLSVKTDGTLWAWGNNSNGRLGLGDTVYRSSPVQVGADTAWLSVSGASASSAAISGV